MLTAPVRVCFVCSGNICRSPTAEVALRRLAEAAGLADLVRVDSAGTGDWHAGDEMDSRARRTMVYAGWDVPRHVAKQFRAADFETRDVVVALDRGHLDHLWRLAGRTEDPGAARARIVVLRAFDPRLRPGEEPDVGDPYYGGPDGFVDVLEQVERSCAALLAAIQEAVAAGADRLQQADTPFA